MLLLPSVSLPLIPYERPLFEATHPLRESPRTLEAADIRLFLSPSLYFFPSLILSLSFIPFLSIQSLYLSTILRISSFLPFLPPRASLSRLSFSILLYRKHPITFGQSNKRACVLPGCSYLRSSKKQNQKKKISKEKKRDIEGEKPELRKVLRTAIPFPGRTRIYVYRIY